MDLSREIVETKNSDIKKSSTAALDDLRKQIRSIEQDGSLSIQNIATETGNRLDDAVKESEESTKNLVEGLEDEHKNSLASYRENINKEYNNQQDSLENYRSTLKEKFTAFFNEVQETTDHFNNQISSERELLDDQRRQTEVKFEEVNAGLDTAIETLSSSVSTNTQNISTSTKQITSTTKDIVKSQR